MISKPIVGFVLTAAVRDRLITTFVFLLLIATSMATFLGSAAVTEQDQFSLVYASGTLRFAGVLCLILFISFHIRRSFESKEVEFLLSRPISRLTFVLSHIAAFFVLAFFIAAIVAGIVFASSAPDVYGWSVWSISLFVEFAIVSILAMFFAMVLSSAAGAALACLGFYALARMMGMVLGIAVLPAEGVLDDVLGYIVELISVFIPRLDLMAQTSWLVYGGEVLHHFEVDRFASEWAKNLIETLGVPVFIALQGIIFSVFLVVCTSFDFVRKQF
jgi:hypothetical protein